jgi:hypothetical protein
MSQPYHAYENTPLWESLRTALGELRANRDVEITTSAEHVIGYLCHQLAEQRLVLPASLHAAPDPQAR